MNNSFYSNINPFLNYPILYIKQQPMYTYNIPNNKDNNPKNIKKTMKRKEMQNDNDLKSMDLKVSKEKISSNKNNIKQEKEETDNNNNDNKKENIYIWKEEKIFVYIPKAIKK